MNLKQSISLMGFMGCGKSTIGNLLAQDLQVPFYDLDDEIENHTGFYIDEIFDKYGEYYFRKIEKNHLKRLLQETPGVISLGGGSPCFYRNIDEINESSISFYLKKEVSVLAERLQLDSNHRPLIKEKSKDDLKSFISVKLEERSRFYNQANHILTSQDNTDILQEIKRIL